MMSDLEIIREHTFSKALITALSLIGIFSFNHCLCKLY